MEALLTTTRRALSPQSGVLAHPAFGTLSILKHLSSGGFFHTTSLVCSRETSINPLQQAPAGLSTRESATTDPGKEVDPQLGGGPGGHPLHSPQLPADLATSRYGPRRAHATLRGARISPRKLNQFVDIVRGQHIEDALIQCQIHTKKAARMTGKLLESARANAVHNHGLDGDSLRVDQAWVGKGQYLRRVSIHGRGRSGVMHKNRAHLTVVLKEEEVTQGKGLPRRVKVIRPVWEREERTSA